MNEKDYPNLYKTVGAFDVFKSTYYNGCYVRALCEANDSARVHIVAHKLLDLNNVYLLKHNKDTQYHSIRRRTITDKRAKSDLYEVALETSISPSAASEWIEQNAMDITPLTLSREAFSTDRVSVGPCRYLVGTSLQYVKIRFDGYSLPVYFSNCGVYADAETMVAIKAALKNDPATLAEVKTLIGTAGFTGDVITKALTRPMNKSNIVESGSFAPKIFVPVSYKDIAASSSGSGGMTKLHNFEGFEQTSDKAKLAAPGVQPVAVFQFTCAPEKDQYGYSSKKNLIVVVDENEVYKVDKTYVWYGQDKNRYLNHNSYYSTRLMEGSVIKKSDLKPLGEEDAFARERAGRALSRKL